MFAGLFEEEMVQSDVKMESGSSASKPPPPPRNHTQLCGLSNLGATCYLNSLLQTLHYTPEFREALFNLGEDELGVYSSEKGADNSAVRLIPVQLQKLFARLLLLNQQSTEVASLTNSFGWNNSEELQQHDVQELNRILFSAIESSLLGTRGQHLIDQLYHGTSVQQVRCCRCSRVSERVEEFQDIQVPLSGRSGLEEALKETYIDTETLQGSDQYRCEGCQQLVDAVRSCRLRKLPHVLTFALLRFLYNFQKGERYKDTSKFKFPLELDMAPFCDSSLRPEEARYELFSVVIHRGSTHSGHYSSYIRDIDDLGVWQEEQEQVQTPTSPAVGQMDFIDCETPSELIQMVIQQLGGSASVTKLCKALQENTGVSWNARFKKQFGSIQKFLRDCPSLFNVDDTNQVTLKEAMPMSPLGFHGNGCGEVGTAVGGRGQPDDVMMDISLPVEDTEMADVDAGTDNNGEVLGKDAGGQVPSWPKEACGSPATKRTKRSQPLPPSGYRWFEFNDAQVSPTTTKAIEKMYQGKQSAYMLFYRRQSLTRPQQAKANPSFGMPEHLLREVATANSLLDEERMQHSIAMNTLKLNIHFSWQYQLVGAALQRTVEDPVFIVRIDRRKPFSELKSAILEAAFEVSSQLRGSFVVNIAKHLSGGVHLYDVISGNEQAILSTLGLADETHLFVWDGLEVGGKPIQTGKAHEPLLLHFTYSIDQDEREMDLCVARSLTLGELREHLAGVMDTHVHQVTVSQVKLAGRQEQQHSMVMVLTPSKDKRTLDELGLSDGDRLAAEKEAKKGVKNLAHCVADKQNKLISLIVEDRCSPLGPGPTSYPVYPIETSKDEVLSSLKKTILTRLGATSVIDGGRLRFDDDNNGLGPPLYENQTLSDAGLVQGQRVVMEPGQAPLESEIVLYFSTGKMSLTYERVVDSKTTVKECCLDMQERMGLKGSQWHLRKTNWCGEPAELLDEETATLAQEKLKSGDTLIVEEGRLPPKGFVQLATFLYSPQSRSTNTVEGFGSTPPPMATHGEALQDCATPTMDSGPQKPSNSEEVPLCFQSPEQYYPAVPGSLLEMGCVEISKDATVEDLKGMILTLPAMQDTNVPSLSFLRVQELVDGRPGKILKQSSHTLRRSKLTSSAICCKILPFEETLQLSSIVFNVCMRNPVDRSYGPPMEVVYDTSNGAEPQQLCGFVARLLELPTERISLAKHKYETFEWVKIAGQLQDEGGRKRKVRAASKVNIKNTPIFLRDGDTIGVKDLASELGDQDDDFSTPSDDRGRAILTAIQDEKKRKRRNKGADIFYSSAPRRPEIGIKIFVPDYSTLHQNRQS